MNMIEKVELRFPFTFLDPETDDLITYRVGTWLEIIKNNLILSLDPLGHMIVKPLHGEGEIFLPSKWCGRKAHFC
jgi:hypothetical protein